MGESDGKAASATAWAFGDWFGRDAPIIACDIGTELLAWVWHAGWAGRSLTSTGGHFKLPIRRANHQVELRAVQNRPRPRVAASLHHIANSFAHRFRIKVLINGW